MGYPPHALIQFGGSLLNAGVGIEIWSCGVRGVADAATGGFLSTPQTLANNLVSPLSTWFTTAANGIEPTARLEWVKVNNINPDGSYHDPVTYSADIPPVTGAGTGVNGIPWFCSVAFTWETGKARGYAHRGRVYPPNYTYKTSAGFISSTDRTSALTSAKNLLTALYQIQAAPTFKVQLAVVSSHGEWNNITGVSVDNVYDVQRRRKNRLTAVRATSTWP